jgi:hypothetical protein
VTGSRVLAFSRGLSHARALAAILVAGSLAAACGSDSKSSGDAARELDEIVALLESVKKGEIVIKGLRSPSFEGPYTFKRGGYVFRFERTEGGDGQLVVSLESRRGSRREPYQALVDTSDRSGRMDVAVRGRLYVHIVSDGPYLLRFTPKHP